MELHKVLYSMRVANLMASALDYRPKGTGFTPGCDYNEKKVCSKCLSLRRSVRINSRHAIVEEIYVKKCWGVEHGWTRNTAGCFEFMLQSVVLQREHTS